MTPSPTSPIDEGMGKDCKSSSPSKSLREINVSLVIGFDENISQLYEALPLEQKRNFREGFDELVLGGWPHSIMFSGRCLRLAWERARCRSVALQKRHIDNN